MTESEHTYVDLIAREAKKPVVMDAGARERIMAAVRAEPVPARHSGLWSRFVEPRVLRLSVAQTAALAAGLVGITAALTVLATYRDGGSPAGPPLVAVAPNPQLPVSHDTVVKFVFVAPQAARVSLVGDFNGWDTTVTPMSRTGGTWTVTVPLAAGRHLYSFVVNGMEWQADPAGALAPDDGFGHANSVVIVRGKAL